jgi:antitoxin component YwqK of YwqJK toxin-antitoxin module
MCEPEEYGAFRIADTRLFLTGTDYFESYKKRWLIEVVEEASDNYLKRTYTTFRGKRHGEYRLWHDNGKLCVQSFHVHGKLHGEYKEWHDNGKLRSTTSYVNAKFHGEYKLYRYNGEICCHAFYKNDEIHSEYRRYVDGQPRVHTFRAHDKMNCNYKLWGTVGGLYAYRSYVNGTETND